MLSLCRLGLVALVVACAACVSKAPQASDGALRVASVYAPHRFDPSRNPQLYALTVRALSDADFRRRLAGARAAGPGRLLPPDVTVDAWLELDGLQRLRSSVTGSFQSFRLEIGGQTVADLATGLNVVLVRPGHGWSTLVVELPPDLSVPGMPVTLVQRRAGATSDVELALDF
jgi:hypothetical protein